MSTDLPRRWSAGRFQLDLERVRVMGIVNVTPDSFSDGGSHADTASALRHARRLLDEGADILDVGGESTRPGAQPVDADEEWRRVGPLLRELLAWRVPLSIDTYQVPTMARALELGVDIVNDVGALRAPGAEALVAASSAGVCLMHMQGQPRDMQRAPHYDDVVAEVAAFLRERVDAMRARGVDAARLCIDPGFGFGKTLEHNVTLARGLRAIAALGQPLLVGVSRKSMIGGMAGRAPAERLAGSLAAALACVAAGARIVRVHDVAATVDALKVWQALHEDHEDIR
jgi:dihydropteroate synthase